MATIPPLGLAHGTPREEFHPNTRLQNPPSTWPHGALNMSWAPGRSSYPRFECVAVSLCALPTFNHIRCKP
eukprot:6426378-Lingulodinium_polyedra.AAC.1